MLRRFGHFTDFELEFGEHRSDTPDLHVLYGPNEAGKSTTLAAIVDVLYGMKLKTPWNFLHNNKVMELEATLRQGQQKTTLKCFKNHWTNSENNRLERFPLDLQGISREEYERRFSFDELTLQTGGDQILNSHGDVGQALFSASAGLANLKERMDEAMMPANAFWMPRKVKGIEITDLKIALADNKKNMDAIRLDTREWKKRRENLKLATRQREKQRQQRDELQQSYRLLEKRKSVQKLAAFYHKLSQQRNTLEKEFIVPLDNALAVDLNSGVAVRSLLEKTREQIRDSESARLSLTDLEDQKQEIVQQLEDSAPDENAQRLILSAKRIQKFTNESAAVFQWQQQQAHYQDIIEQGNTELNAARERLELPPDTDLDKAIPGESQLEELQALLIQEQTFSLAIRHAQEELDKLESFPIEEEAVEDLRSQSLPDIDIAIELLHNIQDQGLSHQLSSAQERLFESEHKLQIKSNRIGIAVEQLGQVNLPDRQWFSEKLRQFGKLENEQQHLNKRLSELLANIAHKQEQSTKLSQKGAVDAEQLVNIKAQRDKAWSEHTQSIDKEHTHAAIRTSADNFLQSLVQFDTLQQQVYDNHTLTAELNVLKSDIATEQEQYRELSENRLAEIEQQKNLCADQLKTSASIFTDSDVISIELLQERYDQMSTLLAEHEAINAQTLSSEKLSCKASEQSRNLLALLDPLFSAEKMEALSRLNLIDLIAQAGRLLDKLKAQRVDHDERLRVLAEKKNIYELRLKSLETSRRELADWQSQWRLLSHDTVFSDMPLAKARDTMSWVASIPPLLRNHREANRQLLALKAQMSARESGIDALLNEVRGDTLDDIANSLNAITEQMKTRDSLKAQLNKLEEKIKINIQTGAENIQTLQSLQQSMGVDSEEQLIRLLIRTEQHRSLNDRCAETLDQIQDASGSDSAAEDIERLFGQNESADLEQQLSELKIELEEANSAYDEHNEVWVLAKRELQAIGDENDYARLHQERENLLLQIGELARECAIARTGQSVLNAAITRFRQQHQSIILSEAQKAFATLTVGRYVQMVPLDDGKGAEKLYVIDQHQKARDVTELSTGTRYQLYLALRAAAYADYAAQRIPLPFVADDIMESFDDQRSSAAFEVLAGMAMKGQVIYLTHHQHLLQLVQDVVGKDNVHIHRYP